MPNPAPADKDFRAPCDESNPWPLGELPATNYGRGVLVFEGRIARRKKSAAEPEQQLVGDEAE